MADTKTKKTTVKKTVKKADVAQTSPLSIPLFALDGTQSTLELPQEVFGGKVNKVLLAQYLRVYSSNQKQGTAAAKTRSEVVGSTKKIYRQKGTGRARHGAMKAPIFVGGGVAGGPLPYDPTLKMNKKQKKSALISSLSFRTAENNIVGIADDIASIAPKTKEVASLLKKMELEKTSVLIVMSEKNENLKRASRNIPNVEIVTAQTVNPFIVLKNRKVVITPSAVSVLKDHIVKSYAA